MPMVTFLILSLIDHDTDDDVDCRGNEEERMTSRTLFLGNLAYHFREADLVEIFKEVWICAELDLLVDRWIC